MGDAQVLLEPVPDPSAALPEEKVGKVFRLHHEPGIYADLAHDPGLGDLLGDLLGEDVDCFLSQFIFKNRRALGQPLHQDAWYFRMTPSDQVGAWLAVTEATLENGPLWVLPGSHREALHDVESDRRPGAQLGYVEITDHDIDGAIPVLLDPGDLLLFHAHLMHRSTDNFTEAPRAAMVYHFGVDDITEVWWSPTEVGIDELRNEGEGMYMFVDGGVRYLLGEMPEAPPKAFDPEGVISMYSEAPESEQSPYYDPLPSAPVNG